MSGVKLIRFIEQTMFDLDQPRDRRKSYAIVLLMKKSTFLFWMVATKEYPGG
jgi:hypothetical protein